MYPSRGGVTVPPNRAARRAQQGTAQDIVAEVKEEIKEAPSRLRAELPRWEDMWERAGSQFYRAPKN